MKVVKQRAEVKCASCNKLSKLTSSFISSEQATQHMTANANEQDHKAQRALKMALNA